MVGQALKVTIIVYEVLKTKIMADQVLKVAQKALKTNIMMDQVLKAKVMVDQV